MSKSKARWQSTELIAKPMPPVRNTHGRAICPCCGMDFAFDHDNFRVQEHVAQMRKEVMNNPVKQIRPPAVAGVFYPQDPSDLRHEVRRYLQEAGSEWPYPKALIVPHAGYQYSGPVAASGYRLLEPIEDIVQRVVLLGPSHRVSFHGLVATSMDEFGWAGAASTYFWIDREEDLIGITMAQYLGSKIPLGDDIRTAVYQALE